MAVVKTLGCAVDALKVTSFRMPNEIKHHLNLTDTRVYMNMCMYL